MSTNGSHEGLPPLPEPSLITQLGKEGFTAEQMREYARVATSIGVDVAADEVLIALKRAEGYEDVHPDLVAQDAINPRWPSWRIVTPLDCFAKTRDVIALLTAETAPKATAVDEVMKARALIPFQRAGYSINSELVRVVNEALTVAITTPVIDEGLHADR